MNSHRIYSVDSPVLSLWHGVMRRPVRQISLTRIAQDVANEHAVSLDVLRADRSCAVNWARQEAMWRQREAGASLTCIGRFWDRHHATVLHACRAHETRRPA